MATDKDSQLQKFQESARAAECDEDEARGDETLLKEAGHKPPPEKPE